MDPTKPACDKPKYVWYTCEICRHRETATGLYGRNKDGETILRLPICQRCREVIMNELFKDWEKIMMNRYTDEQIQEELEKIRNGGK